MLLFAGFSAWRYGNSHLAGTASNALVGIWFVTGAAAIVLAALAFIPTWAWHQLADGTGSLWVFALVAIVLACVAGNYSRALWQPASRLTFALAEGMLKPFVPVVANPATSMLGTPRFQVEIAPECSGFEGVGLMIAFGVAWLLLFRKESRFPQALLLIPAGVIVIYLLNAARLAALILIGNAGAERIALGGFHSQAGWIAFNFVALGFSVAARRTSWFAADVPAADHARDSVQNPVASWLIPFVVILAAGMLARGLSGDFEWLYPLRFFAAAATATLWVFRGKYATLEWRASWIAPAAGIFAFILWIAMDRTGNSAKDAMPAALAAATPSARAAWIFFQVLAAAVTVPMAEELAFRGYLLRRLVAADFESVPFHRFTWVAILLSSAIFGLLHGDRWFAGAVAGCIYALVYMRRGRIVEAVIAYGVTNALIAIDVLKLHRWHLW